MHNVTVHQLLPRYGCGCNLLIGIQKQYIQELLLQQLLGRAQGLPTVPSRPKNDTPDLKPWEGASHCGQTHRCRCAIWLCTFHPHTCASGGSHACTWVNEAAILANNSAVTQRWLRAPVWCASTNSCWCWQQGTNPHAVHTLPPGCRMPQQCCKAQQGVQGEQAYARVFERCSDGI